MNFKTTLRYLLNSLWLYAPGVVTVLVAYFLLINISQGQDVVMQVGERMSSFISALPAVLLWAFFLWYSSRLVGYEKKFIAPAWPLSFISAFPRLLAYHAFVSVQAAILALPTLGNWNFWIVLFFVAVHNGYYFLLVHAMGKKRKKSTAILTLALGFSYALTLLLMRSNQSTHQSFLPLVALLLFVFQVGMLFFFIQRRAVIDRKAGDGYAEDAVDFVTLFGIKVIKVPAWFKAQEQRTFFIFNIVAGLAIGWYLLLFSSIAHADVVGPLAVVLLAFGILAGLANIITHQSMRVGINFFFILLLLAIVLGKLYNPYRVELTEATRLNTYAQRPSLDQYLKKWIAVRQTQLDTLKSYPVYLALADGGASRSGYWVASVLAAWQDDSKKKNENDPFSDHLLALSGASGGSVGNAAFYSLLRFPPRDSAYVAHAQNFLKHDFLTYSLAHYLGPDLVRHFLIGFRARDRATAISHTLNYWADQEMTGAFGKNFDALLDTIGRLPMLFINTTRVQGGTPSVVSSVRLTPFSDRFDVLQLVDSTYYCDTSQGNIMMSTAVVLGARFPYVSPAGSIRDHYFVDGGYFDNSGAGVVHEVLQGLSRLKNETTDRQFQQRLAKLKIHIIHITNTPDSQPMEPIHPLVNDLAAPLLTVFSTYNSQTEVNNRRLENFLRDYCQCTDSIQQINLYRQGKNESYPMNWVISDYQRARMDERLKEVREREITQWLSQW